MKVQICENELIKVETEDFQFFSETRIVEIPRRIVLNFFDDEFVGFVSFNMRYFNRNAYITYYVKKEKRGKGYGKKILKYSIDYAFEEMNMNRLTAEVYEYNEVSIKLLEKFGFKKEGRLKKAKFHNGRYYDIFIYGLLKNERV
ncbi:GCN5 family acetyltransferase [Thermosipho melanesiensis]|uniref:GCN5-related N-acetyltransferase n=2 Tax=Thermosipho melanesiensis TaxID=46541 RepID=A6LJN2_THEM4|nr:GNAT family protein [Thermosipho melanesiensis]ABR30133.1 GCN5-related N-acetyltransferase [Thermosipho melanesiensis BI429]APT73330.1 GCN5 family acetyltransferase [Thermosipho melanesiensis]OOC38720.1 GCN5 family acetyltransferase [Thermosipho melanesiensis]OOC40524.1 GCN5 family acetyltransferase [Thermosipho melanesiensis]OOC40789.1 GCN5 family acetyltransferase [Thermosipho melanesiensis]